MDIETYRLYCLSKPGVTEEFPFDEVTLTFKVMGKIFAITGLDNEEFKVNLKADPEYSIELRENHSEDIYPGFHMNKKHWNTVCFENGLDQKFLKELIDHSYDMVVKGLKKSLKEALKNMG